MATIPPLITALLRSPTCPTPLQTFLTLLTLISPTTLPSKSRTSVSIALTELSSDLKLLATTAQPLLGPARQELVFKTLSKSLPAMKSKLLGSFHLRPDPFDGLLAKHVLFGSGSYLREVQRAKEAWDKVMEDLEGELGERIGEVEEELGMEEGGSGVKERVEAVARRMGEVCRKIEVTVKEGAGGKKGAVGRNGVVRGLLDGEVVGARKEWVGGRVWGELGIVWAVYWSE